MRSDLPEGIRVLHVDDDPGLLDVAAISLERVHSELTVVTETGAAAALERLSEPERIDCVVSDYDMPGMDGLEFLEVVREDYPDLPFVLFTGKGSEEIASEAISAGVTDYLQKESGTDQYALLANRIANIVEGRRSEAVRRRTEERYRTLVDTAPIPIVVYDADGRIVDANDSAAAFVGATDPADIVGEPALSFVHPDERDESRQRVAQVLEAESPVPAIERRIVGIDGEVRHAILTTAPVPFGDETAGQVVIQDVTAYKDRERELESTSNLLTSLVENSPVGILAEDVDRRILITNEEFCDLFGIGDPPEDLIGRDCDAAAASVAELFVESDRFLRTTEEAVEGEIEVDGQEFTLVDGRTIERSATPVPLDVGGDGYLWVYHDVTERKRAEERFRALFENLPDPAVTVELRDDDAITRAVNGAFERVFGYDAKVAIGSSLNDIIVPDGLSEEARRIDGAAQAGEQVVEEVRRRTSDGEVRDFLFRNVLIESAPEKPMAHGIYTDITARKRRERRLDALHEATRQLMATETHDDIASIASGAAEEILGLPVNGVMLYDEESDALVPVAVSAPSREVLGEPPTIGRGDGVAWTVYQAGEAQVHGDVRQEANVFNPDTAVRSELLLPVGDHGVFLAGSTRVDDFNETDLALARVLSANVEAALDRADRERALHDREAALERQNRRLEEFANVVSHDLRNPLSVADGHLDLAQETGETEAFEAAREAHDRMARLIDDLLTLAKHGREIGQVGPVDVRTVGRRAWSTVDTGDAQLEITDDVTVDADSERLTQLFENLLRNAAEHGGDSVTVRVGPLSDGNGFYVEDTGRGLSPDDRDRVFDSGYSTGAEGTGFGLSIVQTIVEAHGWSVRLADSDEGGLRVEVRTDPP